MTMHRKLHRAAQKGATLFVAMIFLLIFAAMAAASLNGAITSTQAISNMQWRNEAVAVANMAMSQIMSGTQFASNPGFTALVNASPTDNTYEVDLNGDGVDDPMSIDVNSDGVGDIRISFPSTTFDGVTATGPRCIRFNTVPLTMLDPARPADRGCYGSATGENAGYATVNAAGEYSVNAGVKSICANTEWVIPLRASDAVTGSSVDVMQGVSVRVFVSDASNSCS